MRHYSMMLLAALACCGGDDVGSGEVAQSDASAPADTSTIDTSTSTIDTSTTDTSTSTIDTSTSTIDTSTSAIDTSTSTIDTSTSTPDTSTTDTSTTDTEPADTTDPEDVVACVPESVPLRAGPFDLYAMFDQSGSMTETVEGGSTRWSVTVSAFKAFVADPGIAGLSVGLQFFGLPLPACSGTCQQDSDCGPCAPCLEVGGFGFCGGVADSCVAADYAVPEVEIGPVADVAATLDESFVTHQPGPGTPTSAALQGAIDHASAWAVAHPTERVSVLLVTDGDPGECDLSIENIAAIAAEGVGRSPSIRTFVVGIGSSLVSLNAIAAGGGTGTATIVDTTTPVPEQLRRAFAAVPESGSCTFDLPSDATLPGAAPGTSSLVAEAPGTTQTVPLVADDDACGEGEGWFVETRDGVARARLCPTSCLAYATLANPTLTYARTCP